jgi:hypothetical protein
MSNMYKDLKHIKMYVEKKNTQANKIKAQQIDKQ